MSWIARAHYKFIRVDSTRRQRISDDVFTKRNTLKNIYLFELQFTTLTETHVNTGEKELIEEKEPEIVMLQYLNNTEGEPIIPGSSLKGVISTNYLALTGSSELTSELFGSDRHPAISKVFFEDVELLQPVKLKRMKIKRAWKPTHKISRSVKVYTSKASLTQDYGYMQCIPRGTFLFTTIRGIGLRDYEVGGLLMSLGLHVEDNRVNTKMLKIGYGKPQGFGQIKVNPENSKLVTVEFAGLTANKKQKGALSQPETIGNYLNSFREEIRRREPNRDLDKISEKLFRRI
ncbi:MAG: RAMP superfamily CRISPR-associated protein [Candidatus Freyarchaeota archaeon]